MEGTGAGPSTEIYELRNLPERISPDIPKTLLKGEELTPSPLENLDINEEEIKISSRMNDIDPEKSGIWRRLNGELVDASLMRVNAELNSTIIDIAFDDIRKQCINQLIDCTIPDELIKVKLTQEVINRFIGIVTDLVENLPPDYLPEDMRVDLMVLTKEQFTSLLDSEVVLGETTYSQLDGAPYDHSVQTFLKRATVSDELFTRLIWKDEEFNARWHTDGNVARFVTNAAGSPVREYFYQNNNPSELATASCVFTDDAPSLQDLHIKIIANDPNNAGVLIEFVRTGSIPASVGGESFVRLDQGLFRGQIDNGGGYGTLDGFGFNISDTPKAIAYTGIRHSFDKVGNLIAGTICEVGDFNLGIEVCDEEEFEPTGPIGSSITDSPYFFQSGEFDSLVAVHDAIRWTVEGLPVEIKGVAVVSADPAIELSEREILCRGFRFIDDDTRMFCGATDEQLNSTIVLELVDGVPGRIIPAATLVQIQ